MRIGSAALTANGSAPSAAAGGTWGHGMWGRRTVGTTAGSGAQVRCRPLRATQGRWSQWGAPACPPPGPALPPCRTDKQQGAGSSAALSSLALTRQRPPPALSTGTPCPQPPSPPRDPPYLSMMTGSEGVSLRFPQLFLSQQRLGTRGGMKGGCGCSPGAAPQPHSHPTMGRGGPAP